MKEVGQVEKDANVSIVMSPMELGLIRDLIECSSEAERPVATRLESVEDLMKGVIDRLNRIENN